MKTPSTEIRTTPNTAPVLAVLNKLFHAQENADIDAFVHCFAHDSNMVNIGTDIDEYWTSWSSFFTYMENLIYDKKGNVISDSNTQIKLSANGDVAWYSQLIDTCFETKGESINLEGFRHTGVMEKRDGKWLIVQSHISIPYHPMDNTDNSN